MKEISNIIKTLKETIEFKKLQKAHEKLIIFLTPNSSTFYKEKIEERDKEIKEYKCVIKEFKKNNKILEKKYQEKIDTLKKVSSSEDQQTQKLLEQIKTLNNEINLNIKNWKISKNQEIILKKEKIKAFNLFLKKQSIMDSSKTEKMNLSKVFNEKLSIKIDNFAILILNEFMKTSDNFNKDIKMSNYTNWANLIQQWSEEFLDENTKNENYDITLKKEIDSVKLLVEFIKPLFKDLRIEDDKKFNEIINIVVNKNYSNKQKQHSLQKLKIKDKQEIEKAIVTMPNYFEPYDTTVHFITEEEMKRDHGDMPHGGFVIRSGETGEGHNQIIPGFTSSVLTAYARAAHRMNKRGQIGAKTVYDVAPADVSPQSNAAIRKGLL